VTLPAPAVYVISGAASGIGAATAAVLRGGGALVAAIDLVHAAAADLAVPADVTDDAAVEAAVALAERELGPITGCLTAAGVYRRAVLGEVADDDWRSMLAVHLDGTANVCRAVYRRLLPRRRGVIVTIGSELALIGDPAAAHYAAAKGAIHAFTKSLAREAAPHGIRVNCVAPGPTDTPLLKPEYAPPDYVASLVLRRLVRPDEIAATVAFLLREETNMVGQIVSPNAGAVM
jgi:2-hydroxycyclohexanecarboxyl-CoA dehydrogenase